MKISKLEPSSHRQGRWLVFLEDGTLLRVGEGDVLAFSLCSGMDLDEDTLAALRGAGVKFDARSRAVSWLTARPMSRQEVSRKLRERKVPDEDAEAICDELERMGLLDDEAYAALIVEQYGARGYGERRLRDELYRRGVPRQFWDGALEDREDPDRALDELAERLLRGRENTPKELKRASDAMRRRGYSWEEVSAALERWGAQRPED